MSGATVKSIHPDRPDSEPGEKLIFNELGVSGLRHFAGYIDEEWHRDLRGRRGVRIYREMADNHPVIGGTFFIIEMIIRQLKYRVDATGDSVEHLAAQRLIETAIEDIQGGMKKVMGDALTMLPFGWAVMEKVFKISRGNHKSKLFKSKFDDGMIRWRKFGIRAQESLLRWDLDEQGEVRAMIQQSPSDLKTRRLPREKFLHIRLLSRKDDPEGRKLLRPVYTSYYFQKQMQFTEAVGVWRNIAGFPKITLPIDYMTAEPGSDKKAAHDKYLEMGKKVAADEYTCVLMPAEKDREGKDTGFTFGLISTSGKNIAATDPIIKRYASWVSIALSSQLLLLGQDGAGSLSLADNQTKLLGFVIAAIVDSVLDPLNEDAVPELCELNGIAMKYAPKIMRGDIESDDLAKLGGFLAQMSSAGLITPDDKLEDHVREVAGVPQKEVQEQPAGEKPGDETDSDDVTELTEEQIAALGRVVADGE